MSAARWAQWFRRSRGGGACLDRLQPVFRAAFHLSNARCVPRVGASRGIKIFLAQCLYVAIRHAPCVPFRHNEKRLCVSHPAPAVSTIVARSGEAKVGAGGTFYF